MSLLREDWEGCDVRLERSSDLQQAEAGGGTGKGRSAAGGTCEAGSKGCHGCPNASIEASYLK